VALSCHVCRQTIDEQQVTEDRINVLLFGALAYGQCPSCRQEVRDRHEPNYRARVRRFLRKMVRA